MTDLAVFMAALALLVSVASIVLGVGNARRLNVIGTRRSHSGAWGLPDGENLPDVVLEALNVHLAAFQGNDRYLLVVGTGLCPACKKLALDLNKRHAEAGLPPLVVIDSGDVGDPGFEQLINFPCSSVRDESKALRNALNATAVPLSYLVSQTRIIGHTVGDSLGDLLNVADSSTPFPR